MLLLYGRDPHILGVRGMVLQSAGYLIQTAGDLGEVQRALSTAMFALMILCHTLTQEESRCALSLANLSSPQMPILHLAACGPEFIDRRCAFINVMEGPARLIATVNDLTSSAARIIPEPVD